MAHWAQFLLLGPNFFSWPKLFQGRGTLWCDLFEHWTTSRTWTSQQSTVSLLGPIFFMVLLNLGLKFSFLTSTRSRIVYLASPCYASLRSDSAICFALYTILELVEVKKLNFTLDKTDPIVYCTYCWTKNHCSIVQPIFQLYIVLWTNSKQKFTLGKSNFFAIFWSYLGCPGKIWKIRIKSGKMFSSLFFT